LASSLLFYGFDMSKGPRGEKRPADVIGAAVTVGQIATGRVSRVGLMRRRRSRHVRFTSNSV
jgi:hypothetical protein